MHTQRYPLFWRTLLSASVCALGMGAAHAATPIIIDDGDASATLRGNWAVFSSAGALNKDALKGEGVTTPSGAYPRHTWVADLPAAGEYKVSIRYPVTTGRVATKATVIVKHERNAAGQQYFTKYFDQTKNGDVWQVIGTFKFPARKGVVFMDRRKAGIHVVDAVKFEAVSVSVADTQATAKAEFDRLASKIGRSTLVADLTQAGSYYLGASQSVTVDDLRGVAIDDNPPTLAFQPNYPTNHSDGVPANTQPYYATGIKPFRFAYFNNEWNYQGFHTWQMSDYGLLNGFNISSLYANRAMASVPVARTQFLQWSEFKWDPWMSAHGYNFRRWDHLPTPDVVATTLLGENLFPYQAGATYRMLDMESPPSPYTQNNLQAESWYPGPAPNIEFERQYYAGFATTQVAASETAKRQGWPKVGIYGWQPFPRIWFGLENVVLDPALDWRWNTYGKSIYLNPNLDLLYPSVYSFYWDERNVAYTLATIDLNMRLVNSEVIRKPVRPYFWHQLHAGGDGWRWWAEQPQRNEDMQAMIALTFFTGVDGLTLWGWSGTENPNSVSVLEARDYMVGAGFMLAAEDVARWGSHSRQFVRYDAIHVLDIDTSGTARFQLINKTNSPAYEIDKGWQPGARASYPIYALSASQLSAKLRPDSEPIAAVIEGLALAKPFEYALRNGEVKIDVSAQKQFKDNSPIVRHIKIGRYHLLATYDPAWQRPGYAPGSVTLTDFDGVPGLDLTLLADNKTRFYAVETHAANLVLRR